MEKIIKIPANAAKSYIEHTFEVKENIDKLVIHYDYDNFGGENVVDFAIKSNEQFLGATGGAYNSITLANDNQTSPGYPVGLKEQYTIVFWVYRACNDFEVKLNINFIEKQKNTFIADLHNHSFCSDGGFTISEIDEFAQEKKIDIVGITDHFAMNAKRFMSDEHVTQMLLGFELTMQWGHMGIYGLSADKVRYQFNSKQEVVEWLEFIKQEYDVYRIVNHPYGNCEDCDWKLDYNYEALEVFNSFDINNNIKSLSLYQNLLEEGNYIPILCGSDTHKQRWHADDVSTHGFPANKIRAFNKSQKEVLSAISNFENECSYYPHFDIDIQIEDGLVVYDNLPVGSYVKVFTEQGEVASTKPVRADNFIRFEVWQDAQEFNRYIKEQIGVEIAISFEQVPIYASNPIFIGE